MSNSDWQQLIQTASSSADATAGPTIACGPLTIDFSRHVIPASGREQLARMATERDLAGGIRALLGGEPINHTENRAVLHTALRGDPAATAASTAAAREALAARERMLDFVARVRGGQLHGLTGKQIRHFVNIGIGGSDLGPRLVVDALDDRKGPIRTHFLANVDGHALARLLPELDPETTLFGVISKSFGTRETLLNATTARQWLAEQLGVEPQIAGSQFIAVSANTDRAREFGIAAEHVFAMFDWVGGRYSLWSNVGVAIAMALGPNAFRELLAGGGEIDLHLARQPFESNAPVQMALHGLWHRNAKEAQAYTVVSYDQRLALLGEFLQQLDMESNGKRVHHDGAPCEHATGPAIFGGVGTIGQHAYFQWLHQGTTVIPIDLVGVIQPDHPFADHHQELLANFAGQAWALSAGRDKQATARSLGSDNADEPQVSHCTFPGGRPVSVITMDRLTPRSLGALIATYEHKVFAQGWLWGINSFDQFGVELGKTLANRVAPWLAGEPIDDGIDDATQQLVARLCS